MNKNYRVFLKCFTVIVLIVSVGCATTSTHVGIFSKASEELATQLEKSYQMVEETTIQRKIVDAVMDPTMVIDDKMFKGSSEEFKSYKTRMKMLRLLRSYSKALGELSATDFREGVDKASKDLFGALTGLKATYKTATNKELGIKDKELAAFATITNAIGTAIIEKKRKKAIRKVVKISAPAIEKICAYVKAELPAYKDVVKINLSTFKNEMKKYYQKEGAKLSFEDRLKFLEKIQKKSRQEVESEKFFVQLGKAVEGLAKAHTALLKAAEKRNFNTQELVKQIGELVNYAKSLKAFYKGLSESK